MKAIPLNPGRLVSKPARNGRTRHLTKRPRFTSPPNGHPRAMASLGNARPSPVAPKLTSGIDLDHSHITSATHSDLDDLVELEQEFDPGVAISRRQFRYLLRRPTADIWVCRQNRAVIGDVVALRRKTSRGLVARIYSLVVAPQSRGSGYGRSLFRHCLAQLRRQGAYAAVLEVHSHNKRAISLYRDEGFQQTQVLANYYASCEHAIRLRLAL